MFDCLFVCPIITPEPLDKFDSNLIGILKYSIHSRRYCFYSQYFSIGLSYLYINLACLGGGLFYPINVKMAEPIRPNFAWDLTWPQGKFMNDQNFKYLPPSKFDFLKFLKILKIHEIFLLKSANFFLFCFTMYTKRTCSHLK